MSFKEEDRAINIQSFEIIFNNNLVSYYTGDRINGYIEIYITNPLEVFEILSVFQCKAFLLWEDRKLHGFFEDLQNHQTFWNEKLTIWNNTNYMQSNNLMMVAGHHSLPFSVVVPSQDMPSSYESKYGAVRYWVTASITFKDGATETKLKPFSVLQKIDLNDFKYQMKISNDAERSSCCSCFHPSSQCLSATLDRCGYCPGEAIAVNCRARNKGRKDVGGLKARLIQKVIYKIDDERFKLQENYLSAIGGNKIERGRIKVWENQLLKIPPIPPTIENCDIITVQYKVQIIMEIPNSVDLQINLPVTIGTIPLQCTAVPTANIEMKRCTEGIQCFHRSSDSSYFHFPLQTFIPYTVFVESFAFPPKRHLFTQVGSCRKREINEEKQPLLAVHSSQLDL